MSRIANKPVDIPDNVEANINNNLLTVKGPLGEMKLDIHGDVIPRVDVSRFLNLPIIIGKNAPKIAGQILKTLSNEPHLFRRIKSLTLVSDRRWDVQLDNQINVHLPEKNPGKAWAHLATVEQGHNIFGDQIQGIDMRLENQLIIKIEKNKTIPGKVRGRNT